MKLFNKIKDLFKKPYVPEKVVNCLDFLGRYEPVDIWDDPKKLRYRSINATAVHKDQLCRYWMNYNKYHSHASARMRVEADYAK